MKTKELLEALRVAGRSDAEVYAIASRYVQQGSGPGSSGVYITHERGRWVVGFYERGVWTPREYFATEDEACQWIYDFYTSPMPEPGPPLTSEEWEESMRITREHVAEYDRMLAERVRKAQEGDESDG